MPGRLRWLLFGVELAAILGEGGSKASLTNSQAHPPSDGTPTNDGHTRAEAVSSHGAERDPPVVLASGHGDGRDLGAVTPFAQESHDEGLNPGGAEKEGAQVVEALGDARG